MMYESRQPVSVTVSAPPVGIAGSESELTREGPVAPSGQARHTLRPVRRDAVAFDRAGLLGSWQQRNAQETLLHCIAQLDAGGALDNLRRPVGDDRAHIGMWFSDSDVYKTLEAIAWRLADVPDDPALTEALDSITDVVEAAQESDGY